MLDVLLSLQQLDIIIDRPKFLVCAGESGSGKTELILAKALLSCSDEKISAVFFWIPRKTTDNDDLLNTLKNFKDGRKNALKQKFHILEGANISELTKKKTTDLRTCVLLIDEFHYRYDSCVSIGKVKFRKQIMNTLPFLGACWMATITLKWYLDMRKFLAEYIILENFSMRPLNVQFPSSHHIAEFCRPAGSLG